MHRSASAEVVTSFNRSDCYRLERHLPGGIRTRKETTPFHGARRVEDWRASFRVRWLIRRFRSGPQSGSRCRVSSPRSPNPACRFPAPGSPVGSCASHTDHRDKVGTGPVNRRTVAAARRPTCLLHRRRCVAEPVHASTTSNRSSSTPSLLHVTRSGLSAIKAGS